MNEAVMERSLSDQIRLYWSMTRPRVLLLVLFTAVPVIGMRPGGWPTLMEALGVLFGTALAGAASSTLNAWFERDTDAQMARTRSRPLPAASVAPNQALGLGIFLSVVSTLVLWRLGGVLAAAIGALFLVEAD